MEFFIKKIFDGKGENDELVHSQFIKFSRGEFKNKAMLVAKNSNGKFSIGTTADYGNELVRYFAERLDAGKTRVTGLIVSTRDLRGELEFVNISQFQGVKKYKIDKEMTGNEIISLCNKLGQSFIGLSFNVDGAEPKIKEKMPKSGRPGKSAEDKTKADFCKIKTNNPEIVKELIFDAEAKSFKEVSIIHTLLINDIIMPAEAELTKLGVDKNDFAEIREIAKRKGKIIREIKVDGKSYKKEVEFVA